MSRALGLTERRVADPSVQVLRETDDISDIIVKKGGAMAQLIVRNLEEAVVSALKRRAARKGRSTEAEHREILRDALVTSRRRTSLKALLQDMPDAGDDADFARPRVRARSVRL